MVPELGVVDGIERLMEYKWNDQAPLSSRQYLIGNCAVRQEQRKEAVME
jgi:hypothetical protein